MISSYRDWIKLCSSYLLIGEGGLKETIQNVILLFPPPTWDVSYRSLADHDELAHLVGLDDKDKILHEF